MANEELLGLLGNTDLAAFNQTVAQSDPYGIIGRSLYSWQPNMTTWDAPTSAVTSFGKSFLSGILQNYAQQNAAEQMNKVIGVLPQLRSDPLHVALPEGVNPEAFANLKASSVIKSFARDYENEQTAKKFNSDLAMRVLGKKFDVLGENMAYDQLEGRGPATIKQVQVGTNADGTPITTTVTEAAPATIVPNSPRYKAAQDVLTNERSLNNDFIKDQIVQDFKYKEQGLKALESAYKDKSGTSDFELIRRAAQMVEPRLAVRMDDQQSIQSAASVLGTSYQAIKSAVSGETKLPDDVRAGMMRIARRGYESTLADYNTIRENFLLRAQQAGLTPSNVVPYKAGKSFSDLYPNLQIDSVLDPSVLKARAAELKAQGIPQAEIARRLRSEYGG